MVAEIDIDELIVDLTVDTPVREFVSTIPGDEPDDADLIWTQIHGAIDAAYPGCAWSPAEQWSDTKIAEDKLLHHPVGFSFAPDAHATSEGLHPDILAEAAHHGLTVEGRIEWWFIRRVDFKDVFFPVAVFEWSDPQAAVVLELTGQKEPYWA